MFHFIFVPKLNDFIGHHWTYLEQRASGGDGPQLAQIRDLTLLLECVRKCELPCGVEPQSVGEVWGVLLGSVLPCLCPVREADLVVARCTIIH